MSLVVKTIFVKDIKGGDKVRSIFLVREKTLAYSQKGAPYLNLRLGDKTGAMDAKIWDAAAEMDLVFKKGDVIEVSARAQSYKAQLQLSIVEVRKLALEEIDLRDYLPASQEEPETMFAELQRYMEGIANPHLRVLLADIFACEDIRKRFLVAPAAKGFHHVYLGGLLEHTLGVVKLLDLVTGQYGHLNRDLVLTGGILHDIGKIYEFTYERLVDYSDEGRLIGHIVMGVELIAGRMARLPSFPPELAMELKHLILSHHGELEYGSPKLPNTAEALVVHMIDDLDAKVNAFQEFIKASATDDSHWTPYHRLLERYLYKGTGLQPPG
jgi:3'-5' exoribonuclease